MLMCRSVALPKWFAGDVQNGANSLFIEELDQQ